MTPQAQADFEQALGEIFAEAVYPPVPFEAASAHECVEAATGVLGEKLGPESFSSLRDETVEALAQGFADWFECEAPSSVQIRSAISSLLVRWPADN